MLTFLGMLLLNSLVTNQAATYKNDQNKRICLHRIVDHISYVNNLLYKVCYAFKRTIERPESLLYTLLTSIQAIQPKTKAVLDL